MVIHFKKSDLLQKATTQLTHSLWQGGFIRNRKQVHLLEISQSLSTLLFCR